MTQRPKLNQEALYHVCGEAVGEAMMFIRQALGLAPFPEWEDEPLEDIQERLNAAQDHLMVYAQSLLPEQAV